MKRDIDIEELLDVESSLATDKLPDFIRSCTECKICYGILKNTRETICCHNLYCEMCISQWVATSNATCPTCRKPMIQQCISNIPIQRIADQIPMTCPNKIRGCKNCPCFKDYLDHVAKCEFKYVNDSNKKQLEEYIRNAINVLIENPNQGLALLNECRTNDPEMLILLLKH